MARVRHVRGGTEKYTEIITNDKMDRKCHAFHRYAIYLPSEPGTGPVAEIKFQQGPIQEAGVNGCSNEDLLAIVRDRLECLQTGKFPCQFNEHAIGCIKMALRHLNDRTVDREKRGVEGQHKA